MTTATNPGNYVDFDEYVGLKLEKTRTTIRTTDVLTALAGVAAMFLGYLLIFVVLDQWVVRGGFGVAWRWVLLSTLMISTISWLVWKIGVPSFRVINGLFAAREIEKAEPGLKSNLLNLIDLKATGRVINPAIRKAMERQAAIQLQHVDVSQAIDHRPLVRTAYVLLAVIVIFCLYALLSPKKISNSIWRGLLPAAEVTPATVTEILDVKPGDMTVQAHQPFVDVQVDLAGEIPAQVLLLYSTADGKQDQPIELRPDQQGETRFKGQLIGEGIQGLMYDVTYYVRAGDATSRQYKITVEQPPYAEIENVRIEFPNYMKLQPIEQANNGSIDAWEGAKVLISAKTNMPVRSALIQFLDDPQSGPTGEEIAMSVTGGGKHLQAFWTLALRSDGTFPKYYRIHCRTEDGRVTTGHVMNPLTIRPDLPPEVVMMHPERDLDAPANAIIAILAQARDPDFELGYLYLNIEKAGQKIVHELLSEGRQPKLTIKHELSLAKLNAAVGDVFEIWIEAYDNKQPRPNTKNTPKVKIRVLEPVSQKQTQEQLAEQKERVDQKLADAEQETNPDQADAPRPMDGDPKDRRQQKDARPADPDQNPQGDPQEDKPQQDQQKQQGERQQNQQRAGGDKKQGGEQQSGSGQSKSGQKGAEGNRQNDPSKDQSDPDSKLNKPLNSDGSQDDAVLQRLNDLINKNNQPKPGESNDQKSTDKPQSASDDAKSDPQQKSSNDKSKDGKDSGSDPEKSQNKRVGQDNDSAGNKKSAAKDPSQKPGSTKDDSNNADGSKPEPKSESASPESASKDENPADQKSPKKGMKEEKSSDGSDAKSPSKKEDGDRKNDGSDGDSKQPSEKTDKDRPPEKPSSNRDNNSAEKPDPTKPVDPKSGEPNGEKSESGDMPNGSKPESKQSSDPSGANEPDPKKGDNQTEQKNGSKSEQKNNGQSQPETKGKPDSQDSKAGSPADKNLPTGMNKNSTKESATEKGGADKPKNGSTDPASKPKGPREQTQDSSNAQKDDSADGAEKGIAKPDRDPNSKATPTKNENIKRDPNEKPEIRPGQSSQDPSDEKPDRTNQKEKDGGKPKSVQRDNDSNDLKSPNATDKSQDQTDSPKGGSKSEKGGSPKGTESGQDSKDAAGQKSGEKQDGSSKGKEPSESGSKSDDGMKDSDKPDSGADSKSKPGSGQSGDKPSSGTEKSDRNQKQPGSQNDKKSGDKTANDKKSTDSKSKEQQSGADKKGDEKPSDASSDKSEKSDAGKSGSEKSESGGGKGDGKAEGQSGKSNGQAKADKPSTQPAGPNTNGGNGGANGDGIADPTHGGDVPQTEQSDDANMEYNKQAAELILQKLKKDLDRGDVDPELLEQLGWTKDEMKQFADRLSKSLNDSKAADESPEAKARQQQFQEMLKNLNLQKSSSQRGGAKEPKRDVEQVESKRTPPPPVYRSAFEKWTRDMARQKPSTNDKPTKKE